MRTDASLKRAEGGDRRRRGGRKPAGGPAEEADGDGRGRKSWNVPEAEPENWLERTGGGLRSPWVEGCDIRCKSEVGQRPSRKMQTPNELRVL